MKRSGILMLIPPGVRICCLSSAYMGLLSPRLVACHSLTLRQSNVQQQLLPRMQEDSALGAHSSVAGAAEIAEVTRGGR